jgi:hypothetical protein
MSNVARLMDEGNSGGDLVWSQPTRSYQLHHAVTASMVLAVRQPPVPDTSVADLSLLAKFVDDVRLLPEMKTVWQRLKFDRRSAHFVNGRSDACSGP